MHVFWLGRGLIVQHRWLMMMVLLFDAIQFVTGFCWFRFMDINRFRTEECCQAFSTKTPKQKQNNHNNASRSGIYCWTFHFAIRIFHFGCVAFIDLDDISHILAGETKEIPFYFKILWNSNVCGANFYRCLPIEGALQTDHQSKEKGIKEWRNMRMKEWRKYTILYLHITAWHASSEFEAWFTVTEKKTQIQLNQIRNNSICNVVFIPRQIKNVINFILSAKIGYP